jgi:hypothetical protein
MQQSATFSLTITIESVLVPPSGALPTGSTGVAYNQAVSASGGNPPYTFSGVTGLPAGLTMSASGVISGTPTTAGTFTITGTVTDTAKP